MSNQGIQRFATWLACAVLLGWSSSEVTLAQTDAPPAAVSGAEQPLDLQELFRSNLQLQEQLRATRLAIEQNHKEAEAAADRNAETARNAEVTATRLNLLEQELAGQRARELEVMERSNRFMLIVVAICASIVILAVLLAAYFEWRAASRMANISAALPAHTLGEGHMLAALGVGQASLVPVSLAEQSNARLLGVIARLEQRIFQLEHMTPTHHPLTSTATPSQPAAMADPGPAGENQPAAGAQPASSETAPRVALWLGKGQSLVSLDQPEHAIACFDEVLQLDPDNTEALIKKGAALERLEKMDDAIACYDRAIAVDGSMTVAYLHKGGLCNRLARHSEALECYEQALRTQEKSHAA